MDTIMPATAAQLSTTAVVVSPVPPSPIDNKTDNKDGAKEKEKEKPKDKEKETHTSVEVAQLAATLRAFKVPALHLQVRLPAAVCSFGVVPTLFRFFSPLRSVCSPPNC
jgi:hypothetical protein